MKQDVHSEDSDNDLVTSYEYHPVFNIKTKVINPNDLVTDITLDENGNVIQTQTTGVVDYDNNTINIVNSFEYNSFGELISKTDAN
jgi:YD repeat-containing protein